MRNKPSKYDCFKAPTCSARSGPVHSLRTCAPVQLSTRKRDIMAFSGLVYEDDKVSYPDQVLRYV